MSQHWAEAFIGKIEQEDRERGETIRAKGSEGGKESAAKKKNLADKRREMILKLAKELQSKHPQWKDSDIYEEIRAIAEPQEKKLKQQYPDLKKIEIDSLLIDAGFVNLSTNSMYRLCRAFKSK